MNKITVMAIVYAVSEHVRQPVEFITGSVNTMPVILARQMVCSLAADCGIATKTVCFTMGGLPEADIKRAAQAAAERFDHDLTFRRTYTDVRVTLSKLQEKLAVLDVDVVPDIDPADVAERVLHGRCGSVSEREVKRLATAFQHVDNERRVLLENQRQALPLDLLTAEQQLALLSAVKAFVAAPKKARGKGDNRLEFIQATSRLTEAARPIMQSGE